MSLTSGSSTNTGWKRRSRAASFSMCLRYSSSVVAPMQRSSPRASIGFSRSLAPTAPSAAPAPTIVCSSSMKRTIWPSEAWTSFSTALRRSSNSPRYFDPASNDPMSRAITRRSRSDSGTSPATIRCARPSTIAVLPTPGSPISTGLFFVRRESTWITRRISSSRPITGSSLPSRASAVRSRPNFSSACIVSSGFGDVTLCGPRTSETAFISSSRVGMMSATLDLLSASASRKCSVEMYSSPSAVISFSARCRTRTSSDDGRTSGSASPLRAGSSSTAPRVRAMIASTSAPSFCRTGTTSPSSCSSSASSRCAGAISVLRDSDAIRDAAATASWALIVKRSGCIWFSRLPSRASIRGRAAPGS